MSDDNDLGIESVETEVLDTDLICAAMAIDDAIFLSQDRIVDPKLVEIMLECQNYIRKMMGYTSESARKGTPF